MLELKNIVKTYGEKENKVDALKGVSVTFRENEFVSILGQSGCGKTTMLNIIGGLDQYTSGDLLISGTSTKVYSDRDWDQYRNSSIGFVFQNYNLISHLSILDNVEMALSLSGINKQEKRQRALDSLKEVGLEDHIYKRPNQLSGGQMQRVAIARALVTNPKILLADEPTGALDSKTSVQVMELIKEISKDRLVIMVTHNPKLAEKYSDRLIRLFDGEIIEDTKPYMSTSEQPMIVKPKLKTRMSFKAALKSSFNNMFTKKGRTIITMFAGSIGIIGIAAVLALSNGIKGQINDLQSDELASPISLQKDYFDFGDLFVIEEDTKPTQDTDESKVYVQKEESNFGTHTNNFDTEFLTYLDKLDDSLYKSIDYNYQAPFRVYQKTSTNLIQDVYGLNSYDADKNNLSDGYKLLNGELPKNQNEMVLIVDENNTISSSILDVLGFGNEEAISYDNIVGKEYKVITNNAFFTVDEGLYVPNTNLQDSYNHEEAITLKITGVIKVDNGNEDTLSSGLYYQKTLFDTVYQDSLKSNVVTAQKASKNISVLNGFDFSSSEELENVLYSLGGNEKPTGITIEPKDSETLEKIQVYLNDYNKGKSKEDQILFSDPMASFTEGITKAINSVTLVLSVIAGISLVVSSLMIGIITYVSVIERTKEIGIMRALGARKKDISRIFNAETLIIGLASGMFGVIIVLLISIPANVMIEKATQVEHLVKMPLLGSLGLIALSTALTLISGLIPSRIAAKKDPVIALRTE